MDRFEYQEFVVVRRLTDRVMITVRLAPLAQGRFVGWFVQVAM